jgi:hypothetical protein
MNCSFCKNKIDEEEQDKVAILFSPKSATLPKVLGIEADVCARFTICENYYNDTISLFMKEKV